MDFSDALRELKGGNLMTRESWVKYHEYIYYIDDREEIEEVNVFHEEQYPQIILVRCNFKVSGPWMPCQNDVLAEDWTILTPRMADEFKEKGKEVFLERQKDK